jgi:C1A family cysteine protease
MAPHIVVNKTVITFTAVALTILAVTTMMAEARDLSSTSTGGYGEEAMKVRHQQWMAEHGRTYRDEAEKAHRFQVFKLELNEFADMTNDEFMAMYTGLRPVPAGAKKMAGFKYGNVTLSDADDDQQTVDWRQKGAVTGIKNQGQCGNNYIFDDSILFHTVDCK